MQSVNVYEVLYSLSQNERNLLSLIWRKHAISRKALAELTGLTGASTTRLTKPLLNLSIIEESVLKDGKRGSPNRPLKVKQRSLLSVGLSFHQHSIEIVLVIPKGEVIEKQVTPIKDINVEVLTSTLSSFIKQSPTINSPDTILLGIGISMPGYRSICDQHWAIHWDYSSLLNTSLEEELCDTLKLPVIVERDAIASLWAERLFGLCTDVDDFFIMQLSQGVGGCAMISGQPITGSKGNAGGIGILFPYGQPRPSASDYEHFTKSYSKNRTKFNNEDLTNQWVKRTLPAVKFGIDTITRLYDPSKIIIAGDLPFSVRNQLKNDLNYQKIDTGYTAEIGIPEICISQFNELTSAFTASSLPVAAILNGQFKHTKLIT
jgi:predicted NBD/HSP70 family sugar kinase